MHFPVVHRSRAEYDQTIETRVREALSRSHVPRLRLLGVRAHAGTVVLSGSVGTFYEKQLASSLSRRVPGVYSVVDAVQVARIVDVADRNDPTTDRDGENQEPWFQFFRH